MKVAQSLVRAGLMKPVRGRAGGFCLAREIQDIRVGEVIRCLETERGLVECMRSQESDCPMIPGCRLPKLLGHATEAFYRVLDDCTLKDLVAENQSLVHLTKRRTV